MLEGITDHIRIKASSLFLPGGPLKQPPTEARPVVAVTPAPNGLPCCAEVVRDSHLLGAVPVPILVEGEGDAGKDSDGPRVAADLRQGNK